MTKSWQIDPTIVDALNSKAFALVNLDKIEEAFPLINRVA